MFCTECGKPIKNGYKFCPYCGNRMDLDLLDEPQNEAYIDNLEMQTPEEQPADPEPEIDFIEDIPPTQECEDCMTANEDSLDVQDQPSIDFSEDSGLFDPPPSFSFQEETLSLPDEPLQNAPYFVYHPQQDVQLSTEPQNKPADSEYRPSHIKKRPAAVLAPIIARGPSLGFKILLIILIVSAALAASVVGYQFLFTEQPFADGWLFGM